MRAPTAAREPETVDDARLVAALRGELERMLNALNAPILDRQADFKSDGVI